MTPTLNRIYAGDCLDVMASWPENVVDTIITDPPYGLSFMGKDWDHGVPGAHFWQEALRVAKPGALLLAFGGTRTYHRLAVAIEDAGWEIRDCLMWLYAQGFPKSLNFGCKCGGTNGQEKSEHAVRSMQQGDISQTVNTSDECGEILLDGLPQQSTQELWSEGPEPKFAGSEQPSLEGRQLHRTGERLSDDLGTETSSGAGERLRSRTSTSDGAADRTLPDANGGSSSHRRESGKQPTRESETLLEPLRPLDDGAFRYGTCKTCGGLKAFKGYGTALKPSWEPIILAMKPTDGTFAQNAEKWGVAGINVDGGRIGTGSDRTNGGEGSAKTSFLSPANPQRFERPTGGRWPANLILDEEAAAMLDGQSGALHTQSPITRIKSKASEGMFGGGLEGDGGGFGDSGGASRFFYVAKSARAERNEGCEGMPTKASGAYGEFAGDGRGRQTEHQPAANHHPTVKPLSLMKYLCNLTRTPTGGIVLDPFCGSGTTLWAAEFHNRPWLGIELNPEYVAIAEARLARERAQIKMAI